MKLNPRDAFLKVAETAWCAPLIESNVMGGREGVRRALMAGRAPERLLPGRFIMMQSPEVRKALSRLTSEMTFDRQVPND